MAAAEAGVAGVAFAGTFAPRYALHDRRFGVARLFLVWLPVELGHGERLGEGDGHAAEISILTFESDHLVARFCCFTGTYALAEGSFGTSRWRCSWNPVLALGFAGAMVRELFGIFGFVRHSDAGC